MGAFKALLGLGTVQFGTPYGISNARGQVPPSEVADILAAARRHGVAVLDTASLYGNSEAVLGKAGVAGFKIVTKTPRFGGETITSSDAIALIDSFRQSLDNLGVDCIHGLMLHHADDLTATGGHQLYAALDTLRREGRVGRIGVSVYTAEQIDRIFDHYDLDLIQVPFNVLDQRLVDHGHLARLQQRGVEVHARSAFLQGLLLMLPSRTPEYFAPIRPLLERWHRACADAGLSPLAAALGFVRDQPGIDVAIVGTTSRQEFEEIAETFDTAPSIPMRDFRCDDPAFINPALWAN